MSDPLDRGDDVYPKRAWIRKNRRAAQIADAYELRREGPWVYSVVSNAARDASNPALAEPHVMIFEYHGDDPEVSVPETLAGLPVRELYNKVFHDRSDIRSVALPDSVLRIGLKVFSGSTALESARLSDALEELDPASFQGCKRLSRVHLPASLQVLGDRLLADCPVGHLELGQGLRRIDWTAAKHAGLRSISIDAANGRFSTDGRGIYSRDGATFLRLLVACERYTLLPCCERVGDSACKNLWCLKEIDLGESVEAIGAYAFFGTGISEVGLPPSLRRVESHAFANCGDLERVRFAPGLAEIGASAFAGSALSQAHLPATLRYLYTDAFAKTPLLACEPADLSIETDDPWLVTDGRVLYERGARGLVATGAFGMPARVELLEGTAAVENGAFEHQARLREASLPEGVTSIGDRAFSGCANLERADFPASLERIGDEAFAHTVLREARIGARLERIGERAFMAVSARPGARGAGAVAADAVLPALFVDAGNARFYLDHGILCERGGGVAGGDAALLYTGADPEVAIPDRVTRIAERAFMRAPLRRLEIPARVREIGKAAFDGLARLEALVLDYDPPLEGRRRVELVFPGDANSAEALARSLAPDADGRLFRYAEYDAWVLQYWLLNKRNSGRVARMILARLDCPVKLSDGARGRFETCLRTVLPVACEEFARHRDLKSFARLEAHGFINVGNIDRVFQQAEERGEAETAAYLLRMKNRKFGFGKRDFSL